MGQLAYIFKWSLKDILELPPRLFVHLGVVADEMVRYEQLLRIEAASFPYADDEGRRQILEKYQPPVVVKPERAWEILRHARHGKRQG